MVADGGNYYKRVDSLLIVNGPVKLGQDICIKCYMYQANKIS